MSVVLLWYVNLYADTDNLPASLSEECALLPLEEATCWARSHLGEIGWWCRGEKSHELMPCRWCRVFSWCGIAVLGEVDIWMTSEHDAMKKVGKLTTQGTRGEGTSGWD